MKLQNVYSLGEKVIHAENLQCALTKGSLKQVLLHNSDCPGTHHVDQVLLGLTDICLSLSPSARLKGVCLTYTQLN